MAKLKTLNEKVQWLRKQAGLSQAELAERVGNLTQQSIDAIENGSTQRPRRLVDIARVLGVTAEALASDDVALDTEKFRLPIPEPLFPIVPDVEPAPLAPEASSFRRLPMDVPVLGTAEGGAAGDFLMNGETIDYLRRPPGLARAKDVFALYVTGASMFPRFSEGEPVYVTTARPPAIGDDVVVELHADDGQTAGLGFIKRLVKRTGTKIVVEQFNPPQQLEFERVEVKNLYRIIPIKELLGI